MRSNSESGDGTKPGQTVASGDAVPRSVAGGRESIADSTATAGGGRAAERSAPSDAGSSSAAGTNSSDARTTQTPPPWTTSSWRADRGAAGEAMKSGRVPDAYRDIVREYFRDGDTSPP
jgi:hypothetical protein